MNRTSRRLRGASGPDRTCPTAEGAAAEVIRVPGCYAAAEPGRWPRRYLLAPRHQPWCDEHRSLPEPTAGRWRQERRRPQRRREADFHIGPPRRGCLGLTATRRRFRSAQRVCVSSPSHTTIARTEWSDARDSRLCVRESGTALACRALGRFPCSLLFLRARRFGRLA